MIDATRYSLTRPTLVCLASALMGLIATSCGDDDDGTYDGPVTLALVEAAPDEGNAGEPVSPALVIETRDDEGVARSGITVEVAVTRGGGSVAAAELVSDGDGRAVVDWTLGVAPVLNRLTITPRTSGTSGDASLDVDIDGVRTTPLQPEPFGDIDAFLTAAEVEGSTEDLAFDGDSRLVIGVPGGLLEVDSQGVASAIELSGNELVNPLGVAFDADGDIWVADSQARALRRVDADGVVRNVRVDDGRRDDEARDLLGPNYIAFDDAGRLYLSDPCLGEVIRIDPETGEADAWLDFDLATQGGPNGLAFDADGVLYLATENTVLLCGQDVAELTAELAGLFRVTVDDDGFGDLETVVGEFALFGDGLAFDSEGNLYVIFDTQADFALEESAVWVLPAGGDELRPLLSVNDAIFANLAFGRGDYGETTVYIAMLAIQPFVAPETRGLMRFELGIGGLL